MDSSDTTPVARVLVAEKVAAVLADMPAIAKSSQAPAAMGGYRFRGIEDILAALKPLLAKHGLFVLPEVVERRDSVRETSKGGSLYVTDLHVRFSICHAEGDGVSVTVWGQGSDSGDKAVQKAMTSAFKSALSIVFCISDSDYDAEAHEVPDSAPVAVSPPAGFATHEEANARIAAVKAITVAAGIVDWVRDQGFEWPWTAATCAQIEAHAETLAEAPF